ncbi:hypothetical protein [Catellatospora sp. NPDC049133]|jgi:hypothetical protein
MDLDLDVDALQLLGGEEAHLIIQRCTTSCLITCTNTCPGSCDVSVGTY